MVLSGLPKHSILLVIFLNTCSLIYPQEYSLPELQGYKRSEPVTILPAEISDYLSGYAESYIGYSFEKLTAAEYRKGKNKISLEIYRMGDKSNTFGIYSFERNSPSRFINIGAQGYKAGSSLNFLKGNHYVKIRAQSLSQKTVQLLENLAFRVADMLPGDNLMPVTLSDFPDDGRIMNTETFISGSILGHKFLNRAFRADYESGDLKFTIYIIDFKSRNEISEAINSYLDIAGFDKDGSESGKYVFRDGMNGTVFLSWKEERMVIITGLEKDLTGLADVYITEILR